MPTSSSSSLGKNLLVGGMILLGVYAVFGQTTHFKFVGFDDNDYVYENPFVARGLTFRGVWWAFAHTHASNWHPLTWISHILDCQCFGLDAGWHHATNFVLHGISACLLLVLLRRLSNTFWASAFVAAMFAIHPLRVESVAWVAERKDILGGLFFFLTLLAYESYVRRGQPLGRYVLATFLFILGLMAKPMLVTLPFVALLLDYWPLGRFRKTQSQADDEPGEDESQNRLPPIVPLLMEKMPWLVLSAASCAITILAQKKAIMSFDRLPLAFRLPNAVVSYAAYLKLAVWPQNLAVFYPNFGKLASLPALIGAVVLLAGISFAVVYLRRRYPYLLVGWLWYVGMLVPVIGILQVGRQAMADRYTYLPLIGIYIALAWTVRSAVLRWPPIRMAVATVATLILSLSLVAAWQQTTFWRDTRTLWIRSLSCTPANALALNNLAVALAEDGQCEEARAMFDRAIEIQPDFATAYYNRGMELAREGKVKEAITYTQRAVDLEPDFPLSHNELAKLLAGQCRWREAIGHLEIALELNPNAVVVQENLAWVLATTAPNGGGDPVRAVALAEHICRVIPSPDDSDWDVLAAAYAADGRFTDALAVADRALNIAVTRGKDKAAAEIRARIKLYEAKKPYRT
ncbi:MAG: tetratricopeptide repeat protein [Planctomycetota bacterium]